MSLRRENDFPATSIGRTSGLRAQAPSGVDAHPLLSPRAPSPAPSEQGSILSSGAALNSSTKYRPYTPRQRVTPTSATTGAIIHPSLPQNQTGDATSKLQLMHLKAAAQTMGLDSGTLGWAILETLAQEADSSEEWTEIWNALTTCKVRQFLSSWGIYWVSRFPTRLRYYYLLRLPSHMRKYCPLWWKTILFFLRVKIEIELP